jgi:histidinol-phosphatase (PHP family)
VHTQWSWDAPREADMARSCEQALAAGLPGLAFTDHLDFTTWTDGDPIGAENLDPHRYARMHLLDLDGYYATLEECRQRYPELRILSGVEIGEAHLWTASAAATVARAAPAGPDRILGSLHAIPRQGRLTAADDLYRLMPAEEVMRRYLAELLRLVEGSGLFQVLAHIDFPRRMWPWSAGPYDEQAFEAEYRAVLRALAASDRVLEVNTKSPLLSAELVRWWRESGGRAVSFGSDAHQPWRVGDKFKLAVDVVEAAGFRAGRDRFDFWRRRSRTPERRRKAPGPPPVASRSRCRRSARSSHPNFRPRCRRHRRHAPHGHCSPGRPSWKHCPTRCWRPRCRGRLAGREWTGSGSARRTAALRSRSPGRGVRHGLRCMPADRCPPYGTAGRRGSLHPRSTAGPRPDSCWPRHTPRMRSNTVRSCFATICNVTLRALSDAMGDKVTLTYLSG